MFESSDLSNTETDEKLVSLILAIRPDAKLIYFFGSRAHNEEHKNSDWDIAVMCSSKLAPLDRFECANALANELNAEVDWVDLLDASTVLQMQIIQNGRLLYDKGAQDTFENKVFAMYADNQERRTDIMKAFKKELGNG